LPESRQEVVFHKYWAEIESLLTENRTVSRIGELTAFLRHYLAFRTGVLFNKDNIYARFRDRMERDFAQEEAFADEIKTINRFAGYYNILLRPENLSVTNIGDALNRLNILEAATAYPLLMGMFDNLEQGKITQQVLLEGILLLENYFVRRFLAGEQSGYTNKMFPALGREIDYSRFAISLRQSLSQKNYPTDNRVREGIRSASLYDHRKQQRVVYILNRINYFLSEGSGAYTILDSEPTIEHIMPQTLNNSWKSALGSDWQDIHQDYLHTLGNLTLVTQDWNASLSNTTFQNKLEKLKNHGLRLNQDYFGSQHVFSNWDAQAIQDRATYLSDFVLRIWPSISGNNAKSNPSGRKPQSVTILGQTYAIKYWRDMAYIMAETVHSLVEDFDSIASSIPTIFSDYERPKSRQLTDKWWIYMNLSSTSVINLCKRLIILADLSEVDWEYTLDEE